MSKHKKEQQNEKIDNQNEQSQPTEVEKEQQEPTLEEKYAEMSNKYLRLYSDFENFRKRTNKERLELIQSASESVIKDLLNVVDDYQRALDDIEKQDDVPEETKKGMLLVYNKLIGVLTQRGLKPIEAIGEKFDEELHEAITQFPAQEEDQKGTVIDEIAKGYYLYDKVIRYSKVVVAI